MVIPSGDRKEALAGTVAETANPVAGNSLSLWAWAALRPVAGPFLAPLPPLALPPAGPAPLAAPSPAVPPLNIEAHALAIASSAAATAASSADWLRRGLG